MKECKNQQIKLTKTTSWGMFRVRKVLQMISQCWGDAVHWLRPTECSMPRASPSVDRDLEDLEVPTWFY